MEIMCFSWNLEGFSRSKYSLQNFLDIHSPDFVFLSEPMLFQCDLNSEMQLFRGEYSSCLGSEDLRDPGLPFHKRAKGGTMALWKKKLDRHVFPCTAPSSSILPIIFSPPGYQTSIHITIYLPTAGKDAEFLEEVVKLSDCVEDLLEKHLDAVLYIRGDANVNPSNVSRQKILRNFCDKWELTSTTINHPTYHHFMGHGASDSQLDVLIHSKNVKETLHKILCKLSNPLITSHHDALLSYLSIPASIPPTKNDNPTAPRVFNNRVKIHWTTAGVEAYKDCVENNLATIRSTWLDPASSPSTSVLLQSTNSFLDRCARNTNPYSSLSTSVPEKSSKKPLYLIKSERALLKSYKALKMTALSDPKYEFNLECHQKLKRHHQQLLRYTRMHDRFRSDKSIHGLCTKDHSTAFKSLRASLKPPNKDIGKLIVGDRTYYGDTVPDGMFDSIKNLKTETSSSKSYYRYPDFSIEYKMIVEICKSGAKIPPLSRKKSDKILNSIRRNVNDYYSITALHYLNAGDSGREHFFFILNNVIANINLAGLPELNTIYACILFKGHGKDRTSERSYRTISTCPLVAKGLDLYIRELCLDEWHGQQAPTQFQGPGMSHEHAALLLTEVVQHSLNVSKLPVFALFLDAKSAFDRVLREILVRNMFLAGTNDHRLLYLDKRLGNRETYCEYNKQLMGPIHDTRGLEQGGFLSSDQYKLYNNEQASVAQSSKLGVSILNRIISCITLADDGVLLSNDIHSLGHLLFLTKQYCSKYQVQLVHDKTKLLVFAKDQDPALVLYPKLISTLSLNGHLLAFSDEAEHLGIIRTTSPGNIVNIVRRVSAYKKQLHALLPAGLALHHHGHPAARLRVERMYGVPVLLSGLAALVLSKHEQNIIYECHKNSLMRLMKLHDRTPDSVVFFLAGSLPITALLHLRQLSLFNMICHLQGNILNILVKDLLIASKPSSRSWCYGLQGLCIQYELPHPLHMIENPIPKENFKKLCKQKVLEYWHKKLTFKACLPSLQYLHPSFLCLTRPHPIWTSLDNNPYQAKAARIQALFLSGRYRSERLTRFWSQNRDGFCVLPICKNQNIFEDIEHIILRCQGLTDVRRRLHEFTRDYISDKPVIKPVIDAYLYSTDDYLRMQFLLDCSVLPLVILIHQHHGPVIHQQLFRISRTWCRSLHVARMKRLGRYFKG